MASLTRSLTLKCSPSIIPTCPGQAGAIVQQLRFVGRQKKLPRATTIPVQLLEDIPKFGRKGAVIPVAPGRMRNIWYPNKKAKYMSREEIKAMPADMRIERDLEFDIPKEKVEIKLLTPMEAFTILANALPPTLLFTASTVAPGSTQMHGSITGGQVANAIRQILNISTHIDDANRVVIKDEAVKFVRGADETGKVKELGSYEVDIDVGAMRPVRRTVQIVKADEAAQPQPSA